MGKRLHFLKSYGKIFKIEKRKKSAVRTVNFKASPAPPTVFCRGNMERAKGGDGDNSNKNKEKNRKNIKKSIDFLLKYDTIEAKRK